MLVGRCIEVVPLQVQSAAAGPASPLPESQQSPGKCTDLKQFKKKIQIKKNQYKMTFQMKVLQGFDRSTPLQ